MKLALLFAGMMLTRLRDPTMTFEENEEQVLVEAAEKLMTAAERNIQMGNMVDLQTQRALRTNDAAAVTPVKLLEHMLAEIKAGRLDANKMAILWFNDLGDRVDRGAAFSGVNRVEAVALLELSRADCVEAWRTA